MEMYHYGIPRKSGRFPFGSGDRPFQGLKGYAKSRAIKTVAKKATSKMTSVDDKTAENLKKVQERRATRRNVRTLSDEEVRRNIQRLRDEKTLKDLLDSDVNPGKKAMDQALQVVKTASISVGTDVAKGALKYAIKTSLTGEERTTKGLADAIWPPQNQKKKKNKNSDDDDD